MTFEMVGRISPIKDTEKFKGYEEKVSPKGYDGRILHFNVLTGGNKHLLSLSSWIKKDGVIYSFSKPTAESKGESLQIPFADRLKPEVINSVADFKKTSITLSDNEKYHYISEWDFIEDINTLLHDETNKNKQFKIRGTVEVTYNDTTGKWYSNYVPQRIYLVDNESKQTARMNAVIYFNNVSFDDADTSETGRAYINGFALVYDGKRKKNLPYPLSISVLKGDTEKSNKVFELVKRRFTVEDNSWKECGLVLNIINGTETVELTYDMLTSEQKELIDLELATLDDIRKEEGNIYGDVIREYRFHTFGRGYSKGVKDTVYTDEDFIIQPSNPVIVDETTGEVFEDIEDLFD